MPDIWVIAEVAIKFALYLGILGGAGTVLIRLWFTARIPQWRSLTTRFSLIALPAALLAFAIKGVALTGDASGMISPDILGLLWSTVSGDALAWRLAGLLILLIASRFDIAWLAAIGGGAALWSFTTIGHVAGTETLFLRLLLFAHLAGLAAWIGILTPLRTMAQNHAAATYNIGESFGKAAAIFVPLLIIAGIVIAYKIVGGLNPLFTTSYGLTMLTKIGFVGVLLAAAAANKIWLIPALKTKPAQGFPRLHRVITFEWACVCIILLMTAIFTTATTPPM